MNDGILRAIEVMSETVWTHNPMANGGLHPNGGGTLTVKVVRSQFKLAGL